MHEDLLGYLLGALEPHEMRRVREMLRNDPAARAELEKLKKSLEPLEDSYEPVEPPPVDLVARTMATVPPRPGKADATTQEPTSPVLVPMHSGVEPPSDAGFSWMDWVSGSIAAAVLLGLLLPALAQGRFHSRRTACQEHLRQFGIDFARFVTRNRQKRLPEVSKEGPEAFAGVYAVRLKDAGLMEDATTRWCPSLDLPEFDEADSPAETDPIRVDEVVTIDQLRAASVEHLKELQHWLGGHYTYTLGVIEQDHFSSPRFEARSSFAIMSDAPMSTAVDGLVADDQFFGHGGLGINVLFEDGRVQFISLSSLDSMPDHPLLNDHGQAEAGVNVDDASLAPSWRAPFLNVRQR